MALRVYKVAVVGCPRAVISPEGILDGVGKSCLCNRFVRSEAYTEEHQRETSEVSHDEWSHNTVFNGDHFVYWGAANKHLPDKSRVRFQVVEQTEFYRAPKPAKGSGSEESSSSSSSEDEERESRRRRSRRRRHSKRDLLMPDESRLTPHQAQEGYISRASAIHFRSRKQGKMAYRLKAVEAAVRRSSGPVRAAMQLFPNEDFGGKKSIGIYGFVCVFDPTLEGEYMQRQLNYLRELLPALAKTKRKVVIACVKCDAVEDHAIRFGSELSSYALKKTIPFFEVSARDSVNVNDVFYSLVCTPRKSIKNGFPGYRETIDSRKGDLNRMKDAFRKSLQLTVTDFSSTWSDTLPLLKMDRSYQSLKQVAGSEADEMIMKLFQLRLIEIKLMEATKKFGHSLVKKADKEKSKEHQVYLKEAFSEHPDLRGESYRDYLPSLSVSDEMESLLTEPSTPSSSICPTPDMMYLRSNTLPDLPVSSEDLRNMEKKLPYALLQQKKHFSFAVPEQTPPPLPSRKSSHIPSPSERKLSNSTDCLFSPEETDNQTRRNLIKSSPQVVASYDRLDAEPYLQPQEIKMVLRHSSAGQEEPQQDFGGGAAVAMGGGGRRNVAGFHSMRVPNKKAPRTMITNNTTVNLKEAKVNYSSSSLDRRTHKRSRSNPFVLEGTNLGDLLTPPQLPPRNTTDSTTSQTTPTHASPGAVSKRDSTLESSLEFASPTLKPLPPIPGDLDNSSVFRTSRIPTSKSIEEENGLDNISQASGPFEEIETPEETPKRKQSSPLPAKRQPGVGLARSATMGPKVNIAAGLIPSHSPSTDSDEDDQYAEITDFQNQQYVQMASVGKVLPASDDTDSTTSGKKKNKKSSIPSATLPISVKKMLKKQQGQQQPSKEKGNESPTPPPAHARAASVSVLHSSTYQMPMKPSPSHSVVPDIRPLPPSPTKGITRKISSGSNIYEVIDEEFLNRVRNRPSRQNSQKEAALLEFIPPVDRALWSSYFEVVRRFFNLPIVQEKWEECVKAAMTDDVSPGDIKPPYPKFWEGSQVVNETLEEEEEQESGDKESEEEKRDSITPLHETAAERAAMGTSLSHRQRAKTTTAITIAAAESTAGKTKEDSSAPSSSSSTGGLQPSTLPGVARSQQKSPVMERLMKISQQKSPVLNNRAQQLSPATARKSPVPERSVLQQLTPSPTLRLSQSPGGSSVGGGHRLQNSAGSDDLILMLNQSQNYESSDDDESDLSDGGEFDLDTPSSTSSESLQQLNAEKAAAPPPPRPTPPAVPAHGNQGRVSSASSSASGPHPSSRPSSHPPPIPKAPTAATSGTNEPYYQTPRQVFGEDYYQTPKQVFGEDYYQIPKEVMKDDDDYYQTPQEVMGEDYYQTPKEVFEYYQTPKEVFAEKAKPTLPPTHTQIPKDAPKEKSVVKKPPPPPRSPVKSPKKPSTKYPTKSTSKPPAVKPKPRSREGSIPETDLDAAIERRASESSDRNMTPSPSSLPPMPPPPTQAKPHPSPLHPLHRKDVAPLELKTSIDSTDSAGPGKSYTNGAFSLTSADESDLVSTDSALTKSPHSWIGGGEFDLERAVSESEGSDVKMRASEKNDTKLEGTPERVTKEEEGVKVVHNVRPSDFLKKRGYRTRTKGSSVSGSLTDSGHFEESVFSPNT